MTIHTTTRSVQDIIYAIIDKQNFRTSGALKGEYVAETKNSVSHYVIYSYDEPIGFLTYYDGWALISNRKFSVTTSRHQTVVRRAMGYVATKTQYTKQLMSGDGTEVF